MSVNKVLLIGRLGANPEVRYTGNGSAVANFNLATDEVWNDKNGQKQKKTEWHRVVVWGKLAEFAEKYLTKGREVYVEGRLQTRSWDDKDGNKRYTTEVVAATIQFVGGRPTADRDASMDMGGDMPAPAAASDSSFTEDEIPF